MGVVPDGAVDVVVPDEAGCPWFELSSPSPHAVLSAAAPTAIIAARPSRPRGGDGTRARMGGVTGDPQNGQAVSASST
jgi:hypothetical protein